MKKIIYFLVALSMMAVGCTKDFDYKGPQEPTSFLSVSPADDIYVTHEGIPWILMPQIKVITDVYMWDWKASTHEVWCGVEASNPQGYFRVHVSKNDTSEDREAVITVSAENAPSVYIKVHQSVSPILSISPSAAQEVPKDGGALSVAVKSIASWSVESDSPWAVVHTQSGEGDGSVEISVAPNPGYLADIATITFRSGETIRKLKINRAGNPEGTYLLIWQGGYRVVPLSGETLTIEVTSNTSWEVSSDQTWAQVETTSGTGNGSTRIPVAATVYADLTPANILFRAGTLTQEVNIYRRLAEPGPNPDPSPGTKYKYVMEGDSYKVAYTISGNRILEGDSYKVAYTISGNRILEGDSYKVAYTISGNRILEGDSYKVAYTISGNRILEGDSYKVVYTLK